MLHKPKTIEGVAGYWSDWAKTPELAVTLSEAMAGWLKLYKDVRENFENLPAPSQTAEDLDRLFAALHRAKAALGRRRSFPTLITQLDKGHIYPSHTAEEASIQWREIEARLRSDIEAVSRLCLLAASAVDEHHHRQNSIGKPKKRDAAWLRFLGSGAEQMWCGNLGRPRLGKPFLNFYNDLCDLAGEKRASSIDTLKKRRLEWRNWVILPPEKSGRIP